MEPRTSKQGIWRRPRLRPSGVTARISKRDLLAISGVERPVYEKLRRAGHLQTGAHLWAHYDRIDIAMFFLLARLLDLGLTDEDSIRIAKFGAFALHEFAERKGSSARYLVVTENDYRYLTSPEPIGPAPAVVIDLFSVGAELASRITANAGTKAPARATD